MRGAGSEVNPLALKQGRYYHWSLCAFASPL